MASSKKPILGAFNQGEVPKIACFNKAVTPLGVDFDDLIAAMQAYINSFVAPIWATPAKLVKSTDFVKGAWAIELTTTSGTAMSPSSCSGRNRKRLAHDATWTWRPCQVTVSPSGASAR